MATPELDFDSLTGLEERIQKTVALVNRLREERDAAVLQAQTAQAEAAQLRLESESLRGERQQVRTRIEKLLGHIDQLGA